MFENILDNLFGGGPKKGEVWVDKKDPENKVLVTNVVMGWVGYRFMFPDSEYAHIVGRNHVSDKHMEVYGIFIRYYERAEQLT